MKQFTQIKMNFYVLEQQKFINLYLVLKIYLKTQLHLEKVHAIFIQIKIMKFCFILFCNHM